MNESSALSRSVSPRRNVASLLSVLALMAAVLVGGPRAGAQGHSAISTEPAPISAVRNVRVCDVYGYSVVLRWDAPADIQTPLSGYYVSWQATDSTSSAYKLVSTSQSVPNAAQIQPLDPKETYKVTITPMDTLGAFGEPFVLKGVQAKGTYEASLIAMTKNGKTGFLYLPANDPPNGRVDITKINSDFHHVNIGRANGIAYTKSCVALNNQQHWHMILSDSGSGAITCRVKGAMYLGDGGTRHLRWDCDTGPYARQTWYMVLTPNKVETFPFAPNNGDGDTRNQFPREQVRIRFTGNGAQVTRYANGNAIASTSFDWRGASYFNVRQLMGLDISQQGLKFLADTQYDGDLTPRAAFATDLSGWKSCYVYFTLGSYNHIKFNDQFGYTATHLPTKEYCGGIMHWGSVAFDAPPGFAPATELSYFQQPDLKARSNDQAIDVSHPLVINIPDPIPADATARELVFTDVSGCMPCLSGTRKLILSVNGVVLPDKQENEVWAMYPTYRWPIPSGVLIKGQNVIVFAQEGTPEPIGIRTLHIDLHVPPTSKAIAAYTPPPAHPILDVMPNHTDLEGWAIPEIEMDLPAKPVSGTISLPFHASAGGTPHLTGAFIGFDQVWAELNGKTVWSQNTNTMGFGSLAYKGAIPLDTTKYPDGYYTLMVKAHEQSGGIGYNDGSGVWGGPDRPVTLTIHNAPRTYVKPVIQEVRMTHKENKTTETVAPGGVYYVHMVNTYVTSFTVRSGAILQSVQMLRRNDNGTYATGMRFSPAHATLQKTDGGFLTTFSVSNQLWGWWGWDKNNQDVWQIVATDADGNTTSFPFSWSLVVDTPAPSVAAAAPPRISQFATSSGSVRKGWSACLTWNVNNAASVTIDNGIGSVSGGGKVCVTPTRTTTYTLTATNKLGTIKKTVTVTVD